MNWPSCSVATLLVMIASMALAQPSVNGEISTNQAEPDEAPLEQPSNASQESAPVAEAEQPVSIWDYLDLIRAGRIENPSQCSLEAVELYDYIEENQGCQTDAECSVDFVGVCPFGCYFALNAESANEVVSTLRQHESDCLMCQFECLAHVYEASCIANRCELREPAPAGP